MILGRRDLLNSKVTRQEHRILIDGVIELGWGKNKETTYIGALESALSVTDRAFSYESLMAVSGLAFRVRWWRGEDEEGQQFCPSSPVGEFETEVERVSNAIGWVQSVDVRFDRPEGHYGFEEDLPQIQASIDAGMPVMCYGKIMDVSVVYGYIEDSCDLLLMDYHGKPGEGTLVSASQIGPMMIFFGAKADHYAADTWFERALFTAIENFENKGFKSKTPGMYYLGEAAINRWIADLNEWEGMNSKHRVERFHPHWWTFSCLYDARLAATEFFKSEISKRDPVESSRLNSIAEVYQEQVRLLGRTFAKKDVFLGPWTGRKFEDWDSQVRKDEAVVLCEFLELEKKAIGRVRVFLEEA